MFDLKNPNLHRIVTLEGLGEIQESSFGGLVKSGKYDAAKLPNEMQNSLFEQETKKLLRNNYIKFQGLLMIEARKRNLLDEKGEFTKEIKEQIEIIKENIYKIPLFHATPNTEPSSRGYVNPESTLGNIVRAGGLLSHNQAIKQKFITEDKGFTFPDDQKTGRDQFVYFLAGMVYTTSSRGGDALILTLDGKKLHDPKYIVQCKALEEIDPGLKLDQNYAYDILNRSSMIGEDFVNIFATSIALGILKSEDLRLAEVMVKDIVPFKDVSCVIQTGNEDSPQPFREQLENYNRSADERRRYKMNIPLIIELNTDTLFNNLQNPPTNLNIKNSGNWYDSL